MLQKLPFFAELESSRSVLLAGCGGGFDVFGALPLNFALRAEGKRVHLACIGFGVDWHHGIDHARFLEATADIAAAGGYLGMFSLLKEMPEAGLYREACEYVFGKMPGNESIVASSILSALDGRFGDYHASARTRGGRLWISPLMSAYWCYRLSAVAKVILAARSKLPARKREGIPV